MNRIILLLACVMFINVLVEAKAKASCHFIKLGCKGKRDEDELKSSLKDVLLKLKRYDPESKNDHLEKEKRYKEDDAKNSNAHEENEKRNVVNKNSLIKVLRDIENIVNGIYDGEK